jgi:hypothetical protein
MPKTTPNPPVTKATSLLKPNLSAGSKAAQTEDGNWHLEIPAGQKGSYRLAQLDDYTSLARQSFPWEAPLSLSMRARASHEAIPGTWGFGLWNDPFSLSLGFGGGSRRLPALPNTAWFFIASSPNYLSIRDDLPAQGSLAATFQSPQWAPALLAPASLALPFFAIPLTGRWLRRLGRRIIHQDAVSFNHNVLEWHSYGLEWGSKQVTFRIDEKIILQTPIVPYGPLGLVMWVDNQYAALPPGGRISFGTLSNPEPAWIEIGDLAIQR